MNINDTGLTNNPDNLRELARDPEHLKKLVALWADNTFVHHLAAELLAVREAQPYGYLRENDGQVQISIGPECPPNRSGGYATPWGAIYAAQPAPAVTDFGALTKLIVGRLIDCGTASDDSIADAEVFVYNACRAAMLQPVSQGYKLPAGFKLMPIDMTDGIGEAIAAEANCCGGIALDIYNAALAAAPTPTK